MSRSSVVVTCALLLALGPAAQAQWPAVPDSTVPRRADGRVNLDAPPPRLPDGKPNLQGVWEQYNEFEIPLLLRDISTGKKPGEIPFQPWAEALYKQRRETNSVDHPGARCLPSGIPEKNTVPAPVKIVQAPGLVLFLYESRTIFRQIFTDGRPLPPADAQPTWQGYSIGRWDGDAFVVTTAGFNDKTWIGLGGHPATEALRVTERFERRSIGRMDLLVTIDDPKAYTRPWTVDMRFRLLPDGELIEHICEENNRDLPHMVGK